MNCFKNGTCIDEIIMVVHVVSNINCCDTSYTQSLLYQGRFDELVIEERRASALELLNFIGKQSHLYKSKIFIKFLEVFLLAYKVSISLKCVV